MDFAPHTPIFIGRAIKQVLSKHPEWRITFTQIGNTYPEPMIETILKAQDLADVVRVEPPVTVDQVAKHVAQADLLFMCMHIPEQLPATVFSGKTFEYLMTDKPVLAAFPEGENRQLIAAAPGTFVCEPCDVDQMKTVITSLMQEKLKGNAARYQRDQRQFSFAKRAEEFCEVLTQILG